MTDVAERLGLALADRYRIEREAGAGGMATVYLAEDLRHRRKVAVKVLHPDLAAALGAERFLAEIRTTASLQHPHILPLHDSGAAGDFLFYVMPFVEGETLRSRLARERLLPIDDAVRIGREVADALGYAHGQGVIHRDIKPENILLQGGHALVADFGIALAVQTAGGQRMTQTGLSLGTPQYMSPEQAMGERVIDARSDLYSLGAVCYEMLTGDPPFTGSTVQSIVARVLTERPASIVTRRDTVPLATEHAVLTALAKLPADRFASAAEFATALTAHDHARPLGQTVPRGQRLDWRVALGVGAMIGALATALVISRSPRATPLATNPGGAQLTFNGRSRRPAISPDGDFVAFVDERCDRGELDPCVASLIVQESGNAAPVTILADVPEIGTPRWTHDGTALLVVARLDSLREGLFLIPRLGGVARPVGPSGIFDTHASGDSVVLIPASGGNATAFAYVIAITTGGVTDSVALPSGPFLNVGWSPDGRVLALGQANRGLFLVRRDGVVLDSLQVGHYRRTIRWTPAGDGLLVFRAGAVREDDLVRFPVDRDGRVTGPPSAVLPKVQTLYRGEFDVARRSGRVVLATGNSMQGVWEFDIAGSRAARQRTRGTSWYGSPVIAPDGRRLFYLRGDALGDNLYSLPFGAVKDQALSADRVPGIDVGVSASGRRVSFGHYVDKGRRLSVIDLANGRTTFVMAPYRGSAIPIGGQGLLDALNANRGLAVLDSIGGRWRELVAPDSVRVVSFAPSPDGRDAVVLLDGDGATSMAVLPLSGGDFRTLYRFDGPPFATALSWATDGAIYFARWLPGDDGPSLWRQPSAGGVPRRVMSLPTTCTTETVVVAQAAPRGTCLSSDDRSDVWLMSVPGVTR